MKIYFCFLFMIGICHCVEDSKSSENWREDVNYGVYRDDGSYDDRKDRDVYDPIFRPCSPQDVNCIRRVFADNSRCSPVKGPVPDPYLMKRLPFYIPQANITFTLYNAQIKGLDGWKIMEFYVNKTTERLVLEVVFDRLVVSTPTAKISVHRRGQEPVEVTDYSVIEYIGVSLTLVLPHIRDLELSRGHVYTYIPDSNPQNTLAPAFYTNKDPAFIAGFTQLLTNLRVSLQEVFVTQGPVFMSVFLQSSVCDFRKHWTNYIDYTY